MRAKIKHIIFAFAFIVNVCGYIDVMLIMNIYCCRFSISIIDSLALYWVFSQTICVYCLIG